MLSELNLKTLQSHRDYPSVSILAPTHRTAPANKQDRIKVKNLVKKAIARLHNEFKKREVAQVVKNLEQLVKAVDWEHLLDGLALFASRDQSAAVTLPFRVKPRAIVDETFATRDIAYSLRRSAPYRVLVLSHSTTLYDAWTTVLEEYRGKPFPMVHRGQGGASKLPGGKGINPSLARDEAQRAYFRSVDEAIATLQKDNPLPLVLVGVERNLAFFHEVTKQSDSIVGMISGNHDKTPSTALGKLVWPAFDVAETARRTQTLVQLDKAVGAGKYASGIDQVWRVAIEKKCRMLLVEKEFKYPADLSAEGDRLLKHTGKGAASLDDVVDEAIERVLNSGGEVFFYSPGDLDVHQKIAAITRV